MKTVPPPDSNSASTVPAGSVSFAGPAATVAGRAQPIIERRLSADSDSTAAIGIFESNKRTELEAPQYDRPGTKGNDAQ